MRKKRVCMVLLGVLFGPCCQLEPAPLFLCV